MIRSPPALVRRRRTDFGREVSGNKNHNNVSGKRKPSNGLRHGPMPRLAMEHGKGVWQTVGSKKNVSLAKRSSSSNINTVTPSNRMPPRGPTPSLWITLLQTNEHDSNVAPTADFIEQHFSVFGKIHSLRFGRGDYCFINFVLTADAKKAMVELNGKLIENAGTVSLKWAYPPPNHSEAKVVEERERRLRDNRQKNDVKIVEDNVFFLVITRMPCQRVHCGLHFNCSMMVLSPTHQTWMK